VTAGEGRVLTLLFDEIETPIGSMLLVSSESGVRVLEFDADAQRVRRELERRLGAVELRRSTNPGGHSGALRAYFAGELQALEAIPVDADGTPFQRRVWSELRQIPVGTTRSYAGLARALGCATATRAVGAANGRNPVAVIVPCHRVVGANGTLTGYGGGLERKRWLLVHERARLG
jgi:methylated-DNA-[protein]-cysteine S-methyltransferase